MLHRTKIVCAIVLASGVTGCINDNGSGNPSGPSEWANVTINEVGPSNTALLEDEFGDTPDWIELYNRGGAPVNLKGCGLTDKAGKPGKWTFGDVTLAPGQYLVVFASGRDVRSLDRMVPSDWKGLRSFIYTWADSANNPPGLSRVDYGDFPNSYTSVKDSQLAISANMFLADNTATSLTWSSAVIHVGFAGWDSKSTVDFSAYNLAFIEATLAKDDVLKVALCQAGVDCWSGYSVLVKGTGEPNHRYPIPIVKQPDGLDLSQLWGFEVNAVTQGKTTPVLITDFIFTHSGYFLHTNFKLSRAGEVVMLTDPIGNVLGKAQFPALPANTSYGVKPGSASTWAILSTPTPGAANQNPAFDSICPQPSWNLASGFYSGAQSVVATKNGPCNIYYTLDGSRPTRNSTAYSGALDIAQTTVLRSVGAADGMLESEPVTHTYFIDDTHELPVISLSTDPALLFDPISGIYEKGPAASTVFPFMGANFWQDTEVMANIEFFEPEGTLGFESGVGVRIFGNYSRGLDMKSLELHFRGEYGLTGLDYPLFPDFPNIHPFNQVVLRNSGGDFGHTMFRDALQSSLTEGMELDYQKYRPAIVYINGQYWGIHNIREKLNGDFITVNHGVAADAFDMLIPGESAMSGTNKEWKALTTALESNGADSADEYASVDSQIDIDNFIDYNCSEIYFTNTDWPGNNVKWWKAHDASGRWRWIFYDLDAGFGSPAKDLLVQATAINSAWPNPTWSTLLLRKLLENSVFKARFMSRCAVRLGTYFEPETVVARIDAMAARIAPEIPRFFTRWKLDSKQWATNVDGLRSFARLRPALMRAQFASYFGLGSAVGLSLASSGGKIIVDGVAVPSGTFTYPAFTGSPLVLRAEPDPGKEFTGWSDGVSSAERTLTLTADTQLVASFN